MGLSDGGKGFRIDLAVLIQYRSVTDTQPPSHVAVAITLYAVAPSAKNVAFIMFPPLGYGALSDYARLTSVCRVHRT